MSRFLSCCVLLIAWAATASSAVWAQEDGPAKVDANELIRNATEQMRKKQKYSLRYQLKKGDQWRWSVEHTAVTKTKIANKEEETASRSNAVKVWTVRSVDQAGNMTFEHSIASVNMWHQIGQMDPVSFDSETDKEVPEEYESVMERVGRPLATITINPTGQVLDRKSELKSARFGAGDITVPLPGDEVSIGHKWYIKSKLNATDENGRRVQLNSRIHYTLANVTGHNAIISFRTEVLTPVESDKVRSQIMQQLTSGYLVFDMNRGLLTRKEVEWDDKVHGYEGPESYLAYSGKLVEKIEKSGQASLEPVDNNRADVSQLKSEKAKEIKRK